MSAVEQAGYKLGDDVVLALDPRGERIFQERQLSSSTGEGKSLTSAEMADYYVDTGAPITRSRRSRTAWPRTIAEGWKALTDTLGDRVQLVGDDAFVTNVKRLQWGIDHGIANSILIKVNQIGTLTETHRGGAPGADHRLYGGHVAPLGRDRGFDHRRPRGRPSCGQIKTGSLARSDRTAKYNQLLRIEEELGETARYAGARGGRRPTRQRLIHNFIPALSTKAFFSLAFARPS